jgi:tetratricopeptide (TPR) repeat protein
VQFEHIKKHIISDLISEIVAMGAGDLELVGHALIEHIEGQRLIHRGLNKDYRPVGYTVDTYSQDSTVVGEYSAKKNYFDNSAKKDDPPVFTKIEDDIDHALTHGTPKKIYLIASQEEPESFRAQFLSTPHGIRHATILNIIDARLLAKYIYDFSITNAESAAFFADFFPEFWLNLQNYEYYGRVPGACAAYEPNTLALDALRGHYTSGRHICVLYGLSGAGKTQTAIDFVHREASHFADYVWIGGEDWKKDTPLTSVQRARGGVPFNIAGAFNSRKTLLIIDSFERAVDVGTFAELETGFGIGSVVLVTSQLYSPGSALYVATPILSSETAAKILGEDPAQLSELSSKFIEVCRFSPLILATARSISDLDGSRDELYKDVLDNPGALAQGDGTSIMKAVLRRLQDGSRKALVKIADSGSTMHDSKFLAHFIGLVERVNLQKLAILQTSSVPGVLKVHDLICEAVKEAPGSQIIAAAVESYVGELEGEMVPSVLRQIQLCASQLRNDDQARGVRTPDWLLYALLQVDRDVSVNWADLHKMDIASITPLAAVLCIVDAKEAHAYLIQNEDERTQYYRESAAAYQDAFDSTEAEGTRAELLHHKGKALRRVGLLDQAHECFLEVLVFRPEWHAAYGQLAHIGTQKEASAELIAEGGRAIRWLVERILQDVSRVPLRVSLATIARLRSYKTVCDEISKNEDQVKGLAEAIALAALEGLDQFFEAYLSFTSIFGYRHSAICVATAEASPEILATPPSSVVPKQWVSVCESLTNTATAAARLGKQDVQDRINKSATTFAVALDSSDAANNAFVARAIAKTFIAAGLPQLALNRIEKIAPEKIDHWLLYQKSRAQLSLGLDDQALESAELALESARQDLKAADKLPIYFDQISKCEEKLGNVPSAILNLQAALDHCKDAQYFGDLSSRQATLTAAGAQAN